MTGAATSAASRTTSADFKFGKEIGHGSFSTVMLAKDLRNGQEFAAKVVNKAFVQKQRITSIVMMEKEALRRIYHKFFIHLICTFQDADRLYFIMEYAERGDILSHLNRLSCFDLESTRFYSAEVIVALEYLHNKNIIHRDIKPENILLTESMHIKICDFGSALILDRPDLKALSFTGTAQFVSPEMLGYGHSKSDSNSDSEDKPINEEKDKEAQQNYYLMDFWALGCVVYQFLSGRMPFHVRHTQHEYDIFQKIRRLDYEFPSGFDENAKDLVTRLLVLNPLERLGNPESGKHEALKNHTLFEGIDFVNISSMKPPLLLPNIEPVVHQDDWDQIPAGFEAAWRFNIMKEFQGLEVNDNSRIQVQERNNPFHRFVRGRLILKQGILFKRRGLFTHKRMFLLTEGPHLFYVDSDKMQAKGEVDLGAVNSLELRSDKVFYIITRKRTYFLEDPSGHAQDWCSAIETICNKHYPGVFSGTLQNGNEGTVSTTGTASTTLPPVASSSES